MASRNLLKRRNGLDSTRSSEGLSGNLLSSLARRKGKNIALLLVYSLLVFLLASGMFFTHALRKEASLVLQGAPEMVVQRMSAGRHELVPHRYLDVIRSIRGVSGEHGRLWGYYFDGVTSANYTLVVPEGSAPAPGHIAIGQDSGFRWNDKFYGNSTFCEFIEFNELKKEDPRFFFLTNIIVYR